jgi:hypothetical protein
MKSFLFGTAVAGFVAMSTACNPFAPDQSVVLDVTKLDAPAAIAAGNPLTVTLTVAIDGCSGFHHLEVQRGASDASITVWGRNASIGRSDVVCPSIIKYEPHSYTFAPPFPSSFTVQVPRGRLSPLTATVQVQ